MPGQHLKQTTPTPEPALDSLEVLLTTMPLGFVAVIAAARHDAATTTTTTVDRVASGIPTSRAMRMRPSEVARSHARPRR